MRLTDYVTLGQSGLIVSPLCLGTMTFGTEWGWGTEESTSRQIFEKYVEAGGNFVDTADLYTSGKSEEMLGKFVRESNTRDKLVVATKFTFNGSPGNPNAGGNGRKNIYRALDASLRRLDLDYIDLYWLHAWDATTPVEEVMSTLDAIVRSGKVRYIGFSDIPAWYIAKAQTIAQWRGWERVIAMQLEYSLVERHIENEHIPFAQHAGIAICPWSPLASGLLSGKYTRENTTGDGGRLNQLKGNPVFEKFTERNWSILDTLLDVANKLGRSPAEVALNWVATQPGITSTLIGATKLSQIESNLSSLDFTIPADLRTQLDEASKLEAVHPYVFTSSFFRNMVTGGTNVRRWMPARP